MKQSSMLWLLVVLICLKPINGQLSTFIKNINEELKHPKDLLDKINNKFDPRPVVSSSSSTASHHLSSSSTSSSSSSSSGGSFVSSSTGSSKGFANGPQQIPSNNTQIMRNRTQTSVTSIAKSGVPMTNIINGAVKPPKFAHEHRRNGTQNHPMKTRMNTTWIGQVLDNKEYNIEKPGQSALDVALFFDLCDHSRLYDVKSHAYVQWLPNIYNNQTSLLNYNICNGPLTQARLADNLVMFNQGNNYGSEPFVVKAPLCGPGSLTQKTCDIHDTQNTPCNQGFVLLPVPFDPLTTNARIEVRSAPPATNTYTLCL